MDKIRLDPEIFPPMPVALVGAVVGATLALAASGTLLRVLFALLMLAVGAHMAWQALRSRPPAEQDTP